HHGEVVVHATLRVDDLQDLAVFPRPVVSPFHARSGRDGPVGERPLEAADLAPRAPGAGAVQDHLLAGPDQMVRPRDGDDPRPVLAPVGLPEEGVSLLDAPLAGRVPALDVEVEVRPAAARALLAEDADLLAHPDPLAGADRRVDRLEVRVAVEPSLGVEDVDVVVIAALVEGDVA